MSLESVRLSSYYSRLPQPLSSGCVDGALCPPAAICFLYRCADPIDSDNSLRKRIPIRRGLAFAIVISSIALLITAGIWARGALLLQQLGDLQKKRSRRTRANSGSWNGQTPLLTPSVQLQLQGHLV